MTIDLTGHHALVCGSTQGIGRGIAYELASAGARVTLMARNKQLLTQEYQLLQGQGHDFIVHDFTKPQNLEKRQKKIQSSEFDILINNTGGPAPGDLQHATWEDFSVAISMHLRTSQEMTQMVLPFMKSKGFGRIINVISTSVKIPIPGLGVSNTVRGAMASWSKTLANELGPFGITVNNLLPGFIETQRLEQIIKNLSQVQGISETEVAERLKSSVPAKRFGQPREMGQIAAFLASKMAGYINGVSIPIDGGRTGSI
jgi:3-oxoacyl-[acyl-carrier protein] reductase